LHPRTPKNKGGLIVRIALLCIMAMPFFAPESAQAYTPQNVVLLRDTVTNATCPSANPAECQAVISNPQRHRVDICPGTGLLHRMMPCIKETVIRATTSFLLPFSTYMARTVTACCILAVIFWGISMAAGKNNATMRDAFVLAVKIGAVTMFTANFGGLYSMVLDATEGLASLFFSVSHSFISYQEGFYNSDEACPVIAGEPNSLFIWGEVDCVLNLIVGGILPSSTISIGLIGFLVACLKSNAIGFLIGLFGILIIILFVLAVFRALYIFVSAYIALSIMMIISPLFIPLILFQVTKAYFTKWLRLTLGFMVQPVIVWAYLNMLMIGFNVIIWAGPNSIYTVLCGEENATSTTFNLPVSEDGVGGIGGCLMGNTERGSAYAESSFGAQAVNIESGANNFFPTGTMATGTGGNLGETLLGNIAAPSCSNPTTCPTFNADAAHTDCYNGHCTYDGDMLQQTILDTMVNPGVLNFFRISVPVRTVDWRLLAVANGYDGTSLQYMMQVLLSMLMGFMVAYIFLKLLDYLPFIGSGLAEVDTKPVEALGKSIFGQGRMMPGNNLMQQIGRSFPGVGGTT